MTNKEVITKAIAYIEANLKNEIDNLRVAQEVCYSLYHFIRLFQSITGFSPNNYIRQRRLTETVFELQNTNKRIAAIAYDYLFGSPEAYSRAFRRQFNVNPSDIRNGYSLTALPLIRPLTSDYISQSGKNLHTPPELVTLPEKILAGISFFMSDDCEINDLSKEWSRLINEIDTIKHKIIPERYYQVQYWSEKQELGGFFCFTGIEIEKIEDLNPLFTVKTIPKGRYLRFIHKGFSNKVGHTYKFIYTQFLPDTNYKLTKSFNYEYYGERYKGPYNEQSESEIYIPVE